MDTEKLAEAVLKLAEIHDRRLGEIGVALGRLADQFTHSEEFTEHPTGIDHLASEISNLAGSLNDLQVTVLQPPEE